MLPVQWEQFLCPLLNLLFDLVFLLLQQAAYHPEVSEELRSKALQYGSECTTGYINLLEQVLQVGTKQSHK